MDWSCEESGIDPLSVLFRDAVAHHDLPTFTFLARLGNPKEKHHHCRPMSVKTQDSDAKLQTNICSSQESYLTLPGSILASPDWKYGCGFWNKFV